MIGTQKYGLLVAALVFCSSVFAQDPQFTQFFNAAVYVNPALVGETREFRMTFNNRNQWLSTTGPYYSTAASLEYNAAPSNSGIGVQVLHDQAGSARLSYTSMNAIYAYKAKLGRTAKFNMGLRLSFNTRYFDRSRMLFASDIAGTSDEDNIPTYLNDAKSYFDVGAGGAIVSRNFWWGFAVDHLARPNVAFGDITSMLDLKYSTHMVYRFFLKRDKRNRILKSATLAWNIKRQNEWNQFDFGGYYSHKGMIFGLFYRSFHFLPTVPDNINHDATIVALGYRWMGIKAVYTYDVTISRLTLSSGGSHEVSLILETPLDPKKRLRSRRAVPCPEW